MCGIVYSKSLIGRPVNKTIMKKYQDQRHRGTDGFGFYSPETNRLTHHPKEGRIMKLLRRNKKATEVLFHHRMPTSTINVRNACHPFSTKEYFKYNYVVVHNGVLYNERSLKAEHERRGIDYVSEQEDGSFNDSEALAYDIARYLEGEVPNLKAQGSIAFIAIKREHNGKPLATYFGRNTGNPLIMQHDEESLTLSSEGSGTVIDPDTLYCFNHETGRITRTPCKIPGYSGVSMGYDSRYYRSGYYGYDEDDELREIYDWNDSFEDETLMNTKAAQMAAVEFEIERLVDESGGDKEMALVEGISEIRELEKIEDALKPAVEVYMDATDDEVDKYYSVGDKLYYLRLAVKKLQKEGQRRLPIGFRAGDDFQYIPDSSGYRFGEERIDADGRAYFPFADEPIPYRH